MVGSMSAAFGTSAKGYVRSHWLGQQSLGWSFWVNFALLRAAIFYMEEFTRPPFIEGIYADAVVAILFLVIAHVMIYAWQVVGVVRACDRYQSSYGSIASVWGIHFGIIVSLLFTLVSVLITFQNFFIEPDNDLLSLVWEREHASKYALIISDDSTYVSLNGSFELGLTKNLRALLQQHPSVKSIVLVSHGGNIYESRGVAKLINEHGLDSYVFESCSSACTTAFIAGATRTLGPNGRLGFHQYGLEADYQVPFVDIAGEQDADRKFYQSQKIKDEFLDRVFDASHSDLWFPSAEELLEAGVVHRIDAKVH